MPTKDPHIAYIDAHEALAAIHAQVQQVIAMIRKKLAEGYELTPDDKAGIFAYRRKLIDATKRLQEAYLREIDSHGKLQV